MNPLDETPDKVLETLLISDWRKRRNQEVVHHASLLRKDCYDISDRGSFDQIAALSTGFESVSSLLFHPFESLIVVAEKRAVAMWDLTSFERVNQFSNENARGSKISATTWINEQSQSLLMCGSDDGVVRLWHNPHLKDTPPQLLSSWLAVRSMPRGSGVGLVLEWQQATGHLLAAGPVDSIRVWDVEREICVLDLPVDSDSHVASLASMADGSVVFAGAGDGVVRMYDLRADNHMIHTVSRHQGGVVNVRVQHSGTIDGDLVSAGVSGDIHISDTRMLGGASNTSASGGGRGTASNTNSTTPSSLLSLSLAAFDKNMPLDALAVHDHTPLIAAGSRKQVVRIADYRTPSETKLDHHHHRHDRQSSLSHTHGGYGHGHGHGSSPTTINVGTTVSTLKYHKGFMGHRIGPVTSVTFHPHKLLLAVGALNPLVSIMAAFPPATM